MRVMLRDYLAKKKARAEKRKAKAKLIWSGKPMKLSRKGMIAKLDALWSLAIRLRDRQEGSGRCLVCKTRPAELGYHLVPKQRGYAVRWDLDNGVAGCSVCNMGEMMNRSLYRQKHVELFGKDRIEFLEAKALVKVKWSLADLASIADGLKEQIQNFKSVSFFDQAVNKTATNA